MGARQDVVGHADVTVEDRSAGGGAENATVVAESYKQWVLDTRSFPPESPPATLTLQMGVTKNLGDYEYARIDVGVSVPCSTADIPDTYEKAKKWVSAHLQAEIRAIDDHFLRPRRRGR